MKNKCIVSEKYTSNKGNLSVVFCLMKQSIIIALFLIPIALGFFDNLQAKMFIRDYSYRAGEEDSKLSARSIALNQVKILLLEEIGEDKNANETAV